MQHALRHHYDNQLCEDISQHCPDDAKYPNLELILQYSGTRGDASAVLAKLKSIVSKCGINDQDRFMENCRICRQQQARIASATWLDCIRGVSATSASKRP